ncbi:hypothetical protein V9T40_004008 [Parthenolecanium corni]|uniref:HTH CENPB-type domain-containing protein n=1 Tax=Parthenolecanium corni TaxID=536013 RepID=A0AAN9TEI3_9HEMI
MSRRAFSLDEKRCIIKKIQSGTKNIALCKEFGTSSSTISTIWRNRDKILLSTQHVSNANKRFREPKNKNLDEALYVWFKQQRALKIPVSGPILQEKANNLARMLGLPDFNCTVSWIQRFRTRHGIVFGKITGESASVNLDLLVCDDWLENIWPSIRVGYADADIFNGDEAGIFYRLTPDKTLRFKGETCSGGKLSQERLTVLVIANMSGTEKRPLLVIGKSKNSRCFKNFRHLLVNYVSNDKAWMTSSVFETALSAWDAELRRQKRKILLLVDNCPSHSEVTLEYIRLVFLPPNTTSVMQPMDQGVVKCLKGHYRKLLVLRMIADMELKKETVINILDAILMLHQSWTEISSSTIANCFRNSGLCGKAPTPALADFEIADELATILPLVSTSISGNEYSAIDDKIITAEILSDEEIVADVQKKGEINENAEDEADDEDAFGSPPTVAEARSALTTLLQYCIVNEEISNFESLKTLKLKLDEKLVQNKNLSTLDKFLKL